MTTVTVYTKPDCQQCVATKRALTDAGIPFETDDITKPENLTAALALGYTSAPVVIAGDQGWAGFRPDLITELANRINKENQ